MKIRIRIRLVGFWVLLPVALDDRLTVRIRVRVRAAVVEVQPEDGPQFRQVGRPASRKVATVAGSFLVHISLLWAASDYLILLVRLHRIPSFVYRPLRYLSDSGPISRVRLTSPLEEREAELLPKRRKSLALPEPPPSARLTADRDRLDDLLAGLQGGAWRQEAIDAEPAPTLALPAPELPELAAPRWMGAISGAIDLAAAAQPGAADGQWTSDSLTGTGAAVAEWTPEPAANPAATGTAGPQRPTRPVTRIDRSPEGRFPVVILGSSGSEPERQTRGILSGRIVRTSFIPMRTSRDWTMLYCLKADDEQRAETAGSISRLEEPYPFVLFRPDVDKQRSLVLHGTLTEEGKLTDLVFIVGPVDGGDKDLILESLTQWEFRPAKLDGRCVPVELLLVIPRIG